MYENRCVRFIRENPYVRTLERARQLAGGDEELAAALQTSSEMLSRWLSGESWPPMKAYMTTVQLVARASTRRRAA